MPCLGLDSPIAAYMAVAHLRSLEDDMYMEKHVKDTAGRRCDPLSLKHAKQEHAKQALLAKIQAVMGSRTRS